jgi:rhodanese-related sulfurtransferase
LLLDLRGGTMIAATGPIPGAVIAEHDRLHLALGDWPKSRPIVTLCACPQDAGAVQAATRLLKDGYLSVRPLKGGYEAWRAAVEMRPEPECPPQGIGSGSAEGLVNGDVVKSFAISAARANGKASTIEAANDLGAVQAA